MMLLITDRSASSSAIRRSIRSSSAVLADTPLVIGSSGMVYMLYLLFNLYSDIIKEKLNQICFYFYLS